MLKATKRLVKRSEDANHFESGNEVLMILCKDLGGWDLKTVPFIYYTYRQFYRYIIIFFLDTPCSYLFSQKKVASSRTHRLESKGGERKLRGGVRMMRRGMMMSRKLKGDAEADDDDDNEDEDEDDGDDDDDDKLAHVQRIPQ